MARSGCIGASSALRRSGRAFASTGHNMRAVLTAGSLAALGMFLSGCVCKEIPVQEKLVDCTSGTLQFKMAVQHDPPYQFLLGLAAASPGELSFRGEIMVT